MYDYKLLQTVAAAVNPDDEEELLQVFNDVKELIGEPVFISLSLLSLYKI